MALKFKQDESGTWRPYRTEEQVVTPALPAASNNKFAIKESDKLDVAPVSDPADDSIEVKSAAIFSEFDAKVADTKTLDCEAMTDEELMAYAIEKGVTIEGMTRRKVINALKKVV